MALEKRPTEAVRSYFFNYAGEGKKEESYEALMALNFKDIRTLDICGSKIKSIAKTSGWINPEGLNVNNPAGFRALVSWLFGREYGKMDRSEIEAYFYSYA